MKTLKIIAVLSAAAAGVFVFTSIVAAQSVSTTATSTATSTDMNTTTSTATSTVATSTTSTTATSTVATTTSNPNAGLQITNNANTATPHEGDTVTFTILVSALGPSTSTNIVATDTLPAGLTFVSASASQGTYASSTGTWAVGDLASGTAATLTIQASVNSGTANQTITNTATVSESSSLVNTSSATSSSISLMVAPTASTSTSTTSTSTTSTGGGTSTSTPTSTIPVPTSTTPAPTSTQPIILVPPVLSISPTGNFLARGMVVTSVASGSFQGQIWGISYNVNWSGQLPTFLFRTGTTTTSTNPSEQLAVGDVLGVRGSVNAQTPLTVNATLVRDYSISGFRTPHVETSTPTSTVGNTTTTNNVSGIFGALQAQINNIAAELQNLRNIFGRR